MIYIVNVSGGLTSYEALRRTIAIHGAENTRAVFADTLIEDNDLYRFLIETNVSGDSSDLQARALALPGLEQIETRKSLLGNLARDTMARAPHLTWLADGRTPFEVWHDSRAITLRGFGGGVAPCSKKLKREVIARWLEAQEKPYTLVFGMDWSEPHRMQRLAEHYAPTPVWFPLAERPYMDKCQIADRLERDGIKPPRLYELGFEHNNCGGGCVKAGQAHFANLLRTLPDVYAAWEHEENRFRETFGKDVGIVVERFNGEPRRPIPLTEFRGRIERGEYDASEWGGCGCFAPITQERMDDLLMDTEPKHAA